MRNLSLNIGLCLFLFAAGVANAGIPPVNVIVSDASGKAAFKGATKKDGGFATEKLQPGKYVVQFNSKDSTLKSGQYSIIVLAGKKKVVANAISGEKFLAGGIAMNVEVGAGLNIVGQVSAGAMPNLTSQDRDTLRKMQDRGQDPHQDGFRQSTSQLPDKMIRP
jgi:hypothetical protein